MATACSGVCDVTALIKKKAGQQKRILNHKQVFSDSLTKNRQKTLFLSTFCSDPGFSFKEMQLLGFHKQFQVFMYSIVHVSRMYMCSTCRPRSARAGHGAHVQAMKHTCRSWSTRAGHGAHTQVTEHHAGHGAHTQATGHMCRPWSTRAGQRTTLWPLPPFRSGGSKLGHQVCTASALPMEPSCQAVLTYLKDKYQQNKENKPL